MFEQLNACIQQELANTLLKKLQQLVPMPLSQLFCVLQASNSKFASQNTIKVCRQTMD